MPLPSSAVGCSPALLWHWFTSPVVSGHWHPESGRNKAVTSETWALQSLPQSLVLSVPLTCWRKMQEHVCSWYWISSAISLCVISHCLPASCLLVHSCPIALTAHARQLFLLRQNAVAPVSCASQRRLFLCRSPRLAVIVLSHNRALWYGSPHRETA